MMPTVCPNETPTTGAKMTVREVAALLGSSTPFVYDLLARGDLPYFRFASMIRIERAEVESYIARSKQGSAR